MKRRKKRLRRWLTAAALAVCAAVFFLLLGRIGRRFPSQQEAARWQGESTLAFSQVSCFLPVDEKLSLREIDAFRQQIAKALRAASVDTDNQGQLQLDAWSANGKVKVSSALGQGEARAVAVGGDFFQFHPLRLLSGSYIAPTDLMQDRVLLDEELAWLLFGGVELSGLSLKIEGVPFVVAGVVAREQDAFSRLAYTGGMGLFMSYEAYAALREDAGVECYEYVAAEPVRGFALGIAKAHFPIGRGEIVQNTGRFALGRLLSLLTRFPTRSMQTQGIVYPYWENACRGAEDCCALFLLLGIVCCLYPLGLLTTTLARLLRRAKERLFDELLPDAVDYIGEAVRVRQRRRWEKRYGRHSRRR